MKILATLWKYQQRFVGPHGEGRWTFIVHPGALDFLPYSLGVAELARLGLVGLAGNGQVALTDSGLSYCQQHADELNRWPQTYNRFDN